MGKSLLCLSVSWCSDICFLNDFWRLVAHSFRRFLLLTVSVDLMVRNSSFNTHLQNVVNFLSPVE
jgi:hypothetical protein